MAILGGFNYSSRIFFTRRYLCYSTIEDSLPVRSPLFEDKLTISQVQKLLVVVWLVLITTLGICSRL